MQSHPVGGQDGIERTVPNTGFGLLSVKSSVRLITIGAGNPASEERRRLFFERYVPDHSGELSFPFCAFNGCTLVLQAPVSRDQRHRLACKVFKVKRHTLH
jgi:hypothetical protein